VACVINFGRVVFNTFSLKWRFLTNNQLVMAMLYQYHHCQRTSGSTLSPILFAFYLEANKAVRGELVEP
jgi:hypothetical protein